MTDYFDSPDGLLQHQSDNFPVFQAALQFNEVIIDTEFVIMIISHNVTVIPGLRIS